MRCQACNDKGIIRVRYESGEADDFALCLCVAGVYYRSDRNGGKHTGHYGWELWCAREGIDPERVILAEGTLSEDKLALIPRAGVSVQKATIAEAMQTRRAKL